MSDLRTAIDAMVNEKGISVEMVLDTIEQALKATYKNKYKTDENAVVTFADDYSSVELASKKVVVADDDFENEVLEIPLSEALELTEDAEVGDELLISIDPKTFNRGQVQTGKQKAQNQIREIQKDELLSEFKNKVGEIINGYVQTIHDNGDMMIDIGKTSGFLPKKNQSPKEIYQKGDRIRCFVESVKPDERNEKNIRVLLSRASEDFIKKLFFINVPELSVKDPSVEIIKIVRETGYRTKVAVYPKKTDVDAVGTCVGLKGVRIQTIMKEIEDERIDVVKWDPNPLQFISNALSPAEVVRIYITDYEKKMAVAIVEQSQLSLAIGKQGLNVRLVNRLCDWLVDVKTQEEFENMPIFEQARAAADAAFAEISEDGIPEDNYSDEEVATDVQSENGEEGISLFEILDENLAEKLKLHDIYYVEEFLDYSDEELLELGDISKEEIDNAKKLINDSVDFVESEEEETFSCPNCGHTLTTDMEECPNCHAKISFE